MIDVDSGAFRRSGCGRFQRDGDGIPLFRVSGNCERRSDRSVCRLHLILAKGGIVSIRRQACEARSLSEGGGAIPSDEATMDIGSILINKIAVRSCRNRSRCYGWTGGAAAAGSAVNCRARRDVVVFATPRLELAQ